MFCSDRQDTLRAIAALGASRCCYMPGAGNPELWPVSRCDCKYGYDLTKTGMSEQTGCPELATLYLVVSAMTDKAWAKWIERGNGILSTRVGL